MSQTPAQAIDYSALTSPVSRADVAAFRTRMRAAKGWSVVNISSVIGLVVVSIFGVFALLSLLTNVIGVVLALGRQGSVDLLGGVLLPLILTAILAFVGVVLARRAFGLGSWVKWYRLTRFGDANGMEYYRTASQSDYQGAIFTEGSERNVTDLLRRSSAGAIRRRTLDIGNYSYVTGSGKSRATHRWGFMAIGLDRAMPNMVLDSRANNGLLGETFPDLMALLVDEAAPFDMEIVDDWLFVYSATPFDVLGTSSYRRLFRIAETVGATLSPTERFADDRVGDFSADTVAPAGRRLRRGSSLLGSVAIAILVVLWFAPNLVQWFGG